jgi:hypothetical protein
MQHGHGHKVSAWTYTVDTDMHHEHGLAARTWTSSSDIACNIRWTYSMTHCSDMDIIAARTWTYLSGGIYVFTGNF